MANSEAEKAVSQYLTYLHDPDSLVDTDRIEELQQQLQEEANPTKRLQLQSELKQCSQPDEEHLKERFAIHAKAWADENGVVADAFIQEGVSPSLLAEAGFDVDTNTRRSSTDEVVNWIRSQRHQFTIQKAMQATGASRHTVRKAMNIAGVRTAGPGDSEGPGRAPELFNPPEEAIEELNTDEVEAVEAEQEA